MVTQTPSTVRRSRGTAVLMCPPSPQAAPLPAGGLFQLGETQTTSWNGANAAQSPGAPSPVTTARQVPDGHSR